MTDYVNEHLAKHKTGTKPRYVVPKIRCADGTTLSVQASEGHYCSPRENEGPWTAVEVWRVHSASGRACHPRSFGENTGDPYGWVPVSVVNAYIRRHGGVA
jgi:hypothetical protein